MVSVVIDSTLLAALVSAVVAFIILTLDRFLIEPRKWRSRYEIRALEKALETHNWLVSVLKVCQQKAKRQTERKFSHVLEREDILNLEEIFERKAWLISEELRQTWYDLQGKDTYFEMMSVKSRERKLTAADLTKMQEQAQSDSAQLQSRYRELTGFRLVKLVKAALKPPS